MMNYQLKLFLSPTLTKYETSSIRYSFVICFSSRTILIFSSASRRICCRCGKPFVVLEDGKYLTREECVYHAGKLFRKRGEDLSWKLISVLRIWKISFMFCFISFICNDYVKLFLVVRNDIQRIVHCMKICL